MNNQGAVIVNTKNIDALFSIVERLQESQRDTAARLEKVERAGTLLGAEVDSLKAQAILSKEPVIIMAVEQLQSKYRELKSQIEG